MPFAARSSSAQADHDLAGRPRLLGEPRHQGVAVLADAVGLVAKQPRDLAQHIGERGAAVARFLRKIRAAPHRLALGRQEHRERPAALLAEQMQRVHVDLVDVGPLLAIDLDVDEQRVHHARGRLVLEALVRHHVAPVARRIADREQDRLVGLLCFGERLGAPRPPVHRIVLVLQQIGRGFRREAVGVRCVRCGHAANLARVERLVRRSFSEGGSRSPVEISGEARNQQHQSERRHGPESRREAHSARANASGGNAATRRCANTQLNGITSTGPRNSVSRIGRSACEA